MLPNSRADEIYAVTAVAKMKSVALLVLWVTLAAAAFIEVIQLKILQISMFSVLLSSAVLAAVALPVLRCAIFVL